MPSDKDRCLCPKSCDCQNPPPDDWDGKNGVYGVSEMCPKHNWMPEPDEDCPEHGHMDALTFSIALDP